MTKRDTPLHVDRYTRAPHEGRLIWCPKCGNADRVYHFSWVAGTCQSCWQMVDKQDWLLGAPDKAKLPQPLPPIFITEAPDYWTLHNGDGSYTGIAVEMTGDLGHWGPCDVVDNGRRVVTESIASAKTLAMGLLKDRKHG